MNSRTPVIVSSVVLFHVAALWALHQGLLQRMVEVVVPVMAISQADPPPPPPKPPEPVKPPEPPKPEPPKPVPQIPVAKPVQPVLSPTPQPPSPEPAAVLSAPTAAPTAPAVPAVPPAPPPPPATAPAPPASVPAPAPKLELPSSKADYLHNPPPDYPRMSKRLGEQGRVVVKVLIGEDGVPQKAELLTSSGFERLDKSAMEAAMRWRYVPGKRGGVAEAMWYQVPIQFTLE